MLTLKCEPGITRHGAFLSYGRNTELSAWKPAHEDCRPVAKTGQGARAGGLLQYVIHMQGLLQLRYANVFTITVLPACWSASVERHDSVGSDNVCDVELK